MCPSGFRIFIPLCSLCLCGESLAADWPQFLGPTRNGVSTETGLNFNWPAKGPPLVWDKEVGEGYSGPVVAGPSLIVYHRKGNEDIVDCLHTANAKPFWQFRYPTKYEDDYAKGNGPRATPLIADLRVYTLSAEGKLHCLDLETGKKVWERSLNEEYKVKKGFFGVATSPLLEDGKIIINVGGKGAGIVAFDKDTGKEAWKTLDHEASYSSPVAATIDGVRHVFFFTREGIVSVDPASGKARFSKHWRARLNASVNAAVPVVADDLLFISTQYSTGAVLHRVRKDSLEEIWKSDEVLSNHYNTSIYRDGYLYGIDGRQEGGSAQLRCVELKSGKVMWTKERFGCASMIWADGHLIALCESGELVLLEATPKAYREKARVALLTAPCRAEIALADGRLYARDNKRLICLDLSKK